MPNELLSRKATFIFQQALKLDIDSAIKSSVDWGQAEEFVQGVNELVSSLDIQQSTVKPTTQISSALMAFGDQEDWDSQEVISFLHHVQHWLVDSKLLTEKGSIHDTITELLRFSVRCLREPKLLSEYAQAEMEEFEPQGQLGLHSLCSLSGEAIVNLEQLFKIVAGHEDAIEHELAFKRLERILD